MAFTENTEKSMLLDLAEEGGRAEEEDRAAKIWYACLAGTGRGRRLAYLREAGTVLPLYRGRENQKRLEEFFKQKEIGQLTAKDRFSHAAALVDRAGRAGLGFCFYGDPDYPARLLDIPDPPLGLFYKGALPRDDGYCVAVVGARMCTEYGRRLAGEIGRLLADRGIAHVSGMALGIDAASHAGALKGGGWTYAVLGSGCDICYPAASKNIYLQIPDQGGLLSEYPPGTDPKPYFFPERNRIISGLSDAVVVVEAREKSGSLLTVDFALDQGRDVYAVPGRPDDRISRGCNFLIEQGAGILWDPVRFADQMADRAGQKRRRFGRREGGQGTAPPAGIHFVPGRQDQAVYACLSLHPKNLLLLMEECGLSLDELLAVLERLGQAGLIEEAGRNAYVRRSWQ